MSLVFVLLQYFLIYCPSKIVSRRWRWWVFCYQGLFQPSPTVAVWPSQKGSACRRMHSPHWGGGEKRRWDSIFSYYQTLSLVDQGGESGLVRGCTWDCPDLVSSHWKRWSSSLSYLSLSELPLFPGLYRVCHEVYTGWGFERTLSSVASSPGPSPLGDEAMSSVDTVTDSGN